MAHEENARQFGADLVVEFRKDTRILTRDEFSRQAPQMFGYIERARALVAGVAMANGAVVAPTVGAVQAPPASQGELDFSDE